MSTQQQGVDDEEKTENVNIVSIDIVSIKSSAGFHDEEDEGWKLVAAKAQADQALLAREKWTFEKEKWNFEKQQRNAENHQRNTENQQRNACDNLTIQLERMKYKEMKELGFSDEVIGEMAEELVPLISSIKKNA